MRADVMTQTPERERNVEAVALFVTLIHARERDQFREAATAVEDMERLGVQVRFRRRKKVARGAVRG